MNATSLDRTAITSHVRVSSATGGQVVFARLAWPGYRVTLDGHDLGFPTIAPTFLAVGISPGTHHGDLVLTWRPPAGSSAPPPPYSAYSAQPPSAGRTGAAARTLRQRTRTTQTRGPLAPALT
ncbi:hypothetical protein IU500_15310 [Nocardia terpenica]|uniref:hypothetical protein n=1 Tax=Nocardia terpenica TaxID=455432 RepID=UPI00189378AA|nr:hypothetical protein [Nocardia terpenica]MBF6061359.1 hypothetical protein [Nocardia terpenica]MBF6105412.1 hypothetical protein [Nocardia terpenica]MBF6113118.1 hypothetical protein [Nocardia terpenica]MBF6119248.1 hypothetical protein [Nocardia terpenica]MBF6152896.1 hypothetical protein [Nocardia terpenica]